ncbi:MAG: GNAT family N-acetyltransferase [Fulvivirga sp.]
MQIRKGTHDDINDIVKLLKLSLGESLMPKTNEYWKWKHIKNPFGESDVLLAYDGDLLVGVRAFMKWIWCKSGTELKSVRAVDTVTHPEYQGRGIFKKLTLQLVDECSTADVSLIYNTPNAKSAPGYLKIGWSKVGKLPVRVSFKKPINVIGNRIRNSGATEFMSLNDQKFDLNFSDFDPGMNSTSTWTTHRSKEFVQWRYKEVPVVNYHSITYKSAFIIFRLRKGHLGREVRIVDAFGDGKDQVAGMIRMWQEVEFDYMSIVGLDHIKLPGLLSFKLGMGPLVTINYLKSEQCHDFFNFQGWRPSLGDLELF